MMGSGEWQMRDRETERRRDGGTEGEIIPVSTSLGLYVSPSLRLSVSHSRMARVLSAIIFLPILFAALWMGAPIWFSAIAAAGILLGLYEYYQLASRGGEVQGLIAAAATLAAFYFGRHELII